MIEGIIADNLFDLIFGMLSGWFLANPSDKKKGYGCILLVFYIISTIGQQMGAEQVTMGAVVHVISFCLGLSSAYTFASWRVRRTDGNKCNRVKFGLICSMAILLFMIAFIYVAIAANKSSKVDGNKETKEEWTFDINVLSEFPEKPKPPTLSPRLGYVRINTLFDGKEDTLVLKDNDYLRTLSIGFIAGFGTGCNASGPYNNDEILDLFLVDLNKNLRTEKGYGEKFYNIALQDWLYQDNEKFRCRAWDELDKIYKHQCTIQDALGIE